MTDLSPKCLNQEAATHTDAAMNAPHHQRQAHLFECLMPGQYMLIDAVDECAVKIEEESRAVRRRLSHGYEILPLGKSYLQEMGLAALDAEARPVHMLQLGS